MPRGQRMSTPVTGSNSPAMRTGAGGGGGCGGPSFGIFAWNQGSLSLTSYKSPGNLFPSAGTPGIGGSGGGSMGLPFLLLLLTLVYLLPGRVPGFGAFREAIAVVNPGRWAGAWLDHSEAVPDSKPSANTKTGGLKARAVS